MAANILKEFANQMGDFVSSYLSNSNIPVVNKCLVVSNIGKGIYSVKFGEKLFTVRGDGDYPPNTSVEVMLPNGKWNRAFIIYPHK